MPADNEKLREARERTGSLTCPEEGLTRQELAEMVNAWIWEHHHTMVAASANYIGQLERGKIRWPGRLYREALRAILKVPKDSELGFINTRRAAVKLENVKRRQLFETGAVGVGALALEGPLAALLEGSGEPTPLPHRIGATDIEQIRTAARMFSSWDLTYGGGLVWDAVMAELRYSARLLDVSCPDQLRPELYSAVGDLADVAGSIALDASAHQEARRVYRFGLVCAEQAEDWNLRANVLGSMTGLEISAGHPDEGLTLAELSLVRADDRLTATGLALVHVNRARALAKMRRVQETLRAIGTAEERFAHATPANDPPYLAYYNAAHLTRRTGEALFDLAILGHHPEQATTRLATAAAEYATDRARARAVCLAKLASLTMATGDPLQAASIGHHALDIVGTLRSRQVTEELPELSRYATPHQHLEEVAHLRHRIATLGT